MTKTRMVGKSPPWLVKLKRQPRDILSRGCKKLDAMSTKEKMIILILYGGSFYVTDKIHYFWRHLLADDFWDKVWDLMIYFPKAFKTAMPSLCIEDVMSGIIGAACVYGVVLYRRANAKKFRHGREYGSARWGTSKDLKPYVDFDNYDNNVLLSQTEMLRLAGRFAEPKYERNKNILVIGGSGSGKTRFFVKPNLMQLHSSYVVTDPKGSILLEVGNLLSRGPARRDDGGNYIRDGDGKIVYEPYEIKIFNTINFDKSMHYNPFAYIHSEKDILKLVNTLIQNTKGEGEKSGEDFWVKAERLLYCAYIGYIWYEAIEEEQNFITLLELIDASETREDDENFKNAVDLIFDDLERNKPNHFAVKQYRKYKLAAGKTAKSIMISCGARLAPFDIDALRELTRYDEMELDMIGDRLTALFVIISDTDDTFNFMVSIMYTQLFNLLCERADDVYGGKLPIHVRCLLDEFANIGQIPKFEKLIATIRSREISTSIILQAKSQLNDIYGDKKADTIVGNCDTMIFLGGQEKTTLKDLEETLGQETIDLYNTSETKGASPSEGMNYQKTGHKLMSQDELAVMDGGKCIVKIRGTYAFFSDKFDITKHKRYKHLSDYDKKNTFDIARYVRNPNRLRLLPSTFIDYSYDFGTLD